MNPFAALMTPCPLIFLSKLSIADEVALGANCGKISLAKGTQNFNGAFLPKLQNLLPRSRLDWII